MGKKVKINLKRFAKSRNLSLREMSLLSGVRHAALSKLWNQERERISTKHLEKLANTFNIDDINEIISFVDVEDDDGDD